MSISVDDDCNFECRYCKQRFERKCSCKAHERYCDKNPNRSITRVDVRCMFVCQFCGRSKFTTVTAHKTHERRCVKNPNRIPMRPRRKWTDSERKHISNRLKIAIKEGRAHGWANSRRNQNGMSYPEVWFSKMLSENMLDAGCEYNKPFYQYKLDFAWPDRRLCIEIDGSQHYIDKVQIESDKRKDSLLKENGWKLLRLKWGYICTYPSKSVELVKQFLTDIGDITVPVYKSQAEIANERRIQCIADGVMKDKGGKFNRLMLTDTEVNHRESLILNSGVDLTCYGWVRQVSEKTGLTRRMIYKLVESCPALKQVVFRRSTTMTD